MSEKNLPIKLFEKRQNDEKRVEGGGGNKPVNWSLSLDQLEERINSFIPVLDGAATSFATRKRGREAIPVTLDIEINEKAIAKSHRQSIKQIFNVNEKDNFISYYKYCRALVKVENAEDAFAIQKNILDFKKNAKGISAVTSIQIFLPEIDLENSGQLFSTLKVAMINYQNSYLNAISKQLFSSYCDEIGLECKELNYSPGITLFKVGGKVNKDALDNLSKFESVKSIQSMPKYSITKDYIEDIYTLEVKKPKANTEYPIVGVLDSGIEKGNRYLSEWLKGGSTSSYPESLIDTKHGTCVASLLVYGDDLYGSQVVGDSGCYLFDATVIPSDNESIDEDDLIDNIRNAIKKTEGVNVWNMSLGSSIEVKDDEFSDFAIALDNIQITENVLICTSAGNCTNYRSGIPKGRITRSADSLLSLVVGSVAHIDSDLAKRNTPSPFSRKGYGPSHMIKPDIASYGGNSCNTNSTGMGVHCIGPAGNVVSVSGTSFATPRVSALLANIDFSLEESFDPLLLKALSIHSAKYPDGYTVSIEEKLKNVGYGIPDSLNSILYNDPNEVTLIMQDVLVKGETIDIYDFPFPESLITEDGCYYGEVAVTLVTNPVLRPSQKGEYCQSDLDVKFGTFDRVVERDVTKPTIINEDGPENFQNLLNMSVYSKPAINNIHSDYSRERTLVKHGKYHPVKKYVVNLDELTGGNRIKYLKTPKKWRLFLRGAYRDFAESTAVQDGEVLQQKFALVVTLRDPHKKHRVYDDVSQLLINRGFAHSNIKLNNTAQVRVDGSI